MRPDETHDLGEIMVRSVPRGATQIVLSASVAKRSLGGYFLRRMTHDISSVRIT